MGNTIAHVDLFLRKAAGFIGFATKPGDAAERVSSANTGCAYPWLAVQQTPLAPVSDEDVEALARRMLNK